MQRRLFFAFMVLMLAALSPFARADAGIGQPAPALIIAELDGQKFDLSDERGKVVVVNFWATWCAPCRAEMPALDKVYRQYHDKGLVLIGISADRARDRDSVADVMKKFSYPAALLGDADTNGFGRPDAVPITYVIDAKGILRAALTPDKAPLTPDSLGRIVRPLLAPQ